MKGYTLSDDQRSITCLGCGMTSHNPMDAALRWCGNCQKWIGEFRCDFCDGEYPVVKDYRAETAIHGEMEDGRIMRDGDNLWAACVDCARLIDAGAWEDLLTRCRVGHEARWAPAEMVLPEDHWREAALFLWRSVFGERFTLR